MAGQKMINCCAMENFCFSPTGDGWFNQQLPAAD